MTKEEFEKYFYRIIPSDLLSNLEPWQVDKIKTMVLKAYKKGKEYDPKQPTQ